MNTKRHILEFVVGYEEDFRRLPTRAEVLTHFSFLAPADVDTCLGLLARDGFLSVNKRGRITRAPAQMRLLPTVPLQGSVVAGFAPRPLPPPLRGSLSLDLSAAGLHLGQRAYALQVRGDSMIDAHIHEGDIVILEPGCPRHGDIVAATVDGQTILKRFVVLRGVPYFKAENRRQPGLLPAHNEPVCGVFKALLRVAQPTPGLKGIVPPALPAVRYGGLATKLPRRVRPAASRQRQPGQPPARKSAVTWL